MPRAMIKVWAAFALGVMAAEASAQQPPPQVDLGPARPGAQYCSTCHRERPDDSREYWAGKHWSGWDADPHRRASEVLEQPLGVKMGELLAKHSSAPNSWKKGVRNDVRCTSCHGGIVKVDTVQQGPVPGLSCLACHQLPAEKGAKENELWWEGHTRLNPGKTDPKKTIWRELRSEQKKLTGFRPLHDASERAAMCNSCHIGNAKEGKFVTHDMYAAGHPPLTSIELAKFSEDAYTETHWLPPTDKRKIDAGYPNDSAAFRVQLAYQGSLDALRRQAEMAEASAKPEGAYKHINWGDYSFFDCASCHHDLTEKSWRRKRAESGPRATGSKVYGRPPLLEWPSAAAFAVQGESLLSPLEELRFAATETPFGNPVKVAEAARKLSAALATTAPKLAEPADWRNLLRQSLDLGAKNDLDFDSARQIAWLSESLAKSLGDKDPTAKAVLANYSQLSFTTDPRTLPKWIRSKDEKAKNELPKLDSPDRLAGLDAMLAAKRKYDPASFREWCKKALAAAPPGS
jgi:hypothetical protein